MERWVNIDMKGTVVRVPTITSSSKGVTTMPWWGGDTQCSEFVSSKREPEDY